MCVGSSPPARGIIRTHQFRYVPGPLGLNWIWDPYHVPVRLSLRKRLIIEIIQILSSVDRADNLCNWRTINKKYILQSNQSLCTLRVPQTNEYKYQTILPSKGKSTISLIETLLHFLQSTMPTTMVFILQILFLKPKSHL